MLEQSVAEKYKKESYSYNYGEADLLSIPKDDQLRPRNMQNRMVFSDVQDSVLNTRNITEYSYDAFGRRVETNHYLGDYTRNLYDGFSFDVIGKSVLQSASPVTLPDQKYRTPSSSSRQPTSSGRNTVGTEIGTRYRYIDENPLVALSEAGTNSTTSTTTAKTRSRPDSEYVLYSYGEPMAMSSDNNTSYFGIDILGSVRSVTDKYGAVQADYSYDVFGSPYLGNLETYIGFGYCGKVYDVGTGLYDYGFRDYSPVSARFTTVDPVRDGANWFSYVVNDPVNYVDLLGLKSCKTASDGEYKTRIFTEQEVEQIKKALDKLKDDIAKMKEDSYEKPISEKIVKLAKDYLGLDLNNHSDLNKYQRLIHKIDDIAKDFNMSDFKDGNSNKLYPAYVKKNESGNNIYLTAFFSLILSGNTTTTPETAFFHEFTHFTNSLNTLDIYDAFKEYGNLKTKEEMQTFVKENLKDSGKIMSAQNWEWFYYNYFKDN